MNKKHKPLTDLQAYNFFVMAGASFLNFLEQQLSDKELALMIDGFLAWATANYPGRPEASAQAIQVAWNAFSGDCLRRGGERLRAQTRVIETFRERETQES